jgi:hypothetical protein
MSFLSSRGDWCRTATSTPKPTPPPPPPPPPPFFHASETYITKINKKETALSRKSMLDFLCNPNFKKPLLNLAQADFFCYSHMANLFSVDSSLMLVLLFSYFRF